MSYPIKIDISNALMLRLLTKTFHFPIYLVTALTDSGTEHVENITVTSTDPNTGISW